MSPLPSTNLTRLILISCALAGAVLGMALILAVGALIPSTLEVQGQLLVLICGALLGVLIGRLWLRLYQTARRFEHSGRHIQDLYQITPALLYSIDREGRILQVSQAWLEFLGYDRTDVIGADFFKFVVTEDTEALRAEHFRKLETRGEIKDESYQLLQASGTPIEVSISEIPQRDPEGRLEKSLAVMQDLTKHRAAEERIERLAYYDPLTGLPNRALMNDRIVQAVAFARREKRQVGVFFIDLDRFKLINDTQGHAVGDQVLRAVARRLKKFIREGDTCARIGGDEFVIVQADPSHDPNFTTMGRRILESLGQPFRIAHRDFFTTASVGVAIYPMDGHNPQALLKRADMAMYVAKSRGRNNMQFCSEEMNAEVLARSQRANRLREALNGGNLPLYFQPQVNLLTGRITGVEALLRWHDQDGVLVPPSLAFEIAEENGFVFTLGEWVMKKACTQSRVWEDMGLSPLRMSVNLSGHHIRQANFIDEIQSILKETGVEPSQLEIELTENSIMGHVNDSIMALTDLKIHGINLAIDNFGSGYSSLLYLKHFPIQRIKIDQEFIRDILHNSDYAAITEAILSMAKSLRLQVTAVGVEDTLQMNFLCERGCVEMQGNLFGPVMSPEQMTEFLKSSDGQFASFNPPGKKQPLNVKGSTKIH